MSVVAYEGNSFHRTGMEKGSRIDFVVVSNEIQVEAKIVKRQMSDHNVVMVELQGKNATLRPR